MRRGEDGDVAVVILPLVVVITAAQQVGFLVQGARLMVENEVILRQLRSPSAPVVGLASEAVGNIGGSGDPSRFRRLRWRPLGNDTTCRVLA